MHADQDFQIRLLDYAQGGADPGLAAHIDGCEACRESLFALQQLIQYRQTTGSALTDPPASILAEASGLFTRLRPDLAAKPPPVAAPLWEQTWQLVATLILDTGATPQVAGFRSAADRRTRQLAFVSDIADLELEVSRIGETCSVSGQLGMDSVPVKLKITLEIEEAVVLSSGVRM